MIKKDILIAVIDGQGGGIGRQYIESLTKQLPKDLPVIIRALGTNSAATSNMLRGGATEKTPSLKMPARRISLSVLLRLLFPIPSSVNYRQKWPMPSARVTLCGF